MESRRGREGWVESRTAGRRDGIEEEEGGNRIAESFNGSEVCPSWTSDGRRDGRTRG